ncbi:MAG: V-type ATP synthase subunit E family protein [Erysipelotrichaceae bacterium]
MRNYDELASFMRDAIERVANKELEVIEKEIRAQEKQLLESAQQDAKRIVEAETAQKKERLKAATAQRLATIKKNSDQTIIRKRNELFNGLYNELDQKMEAYVQSDAYVENMITKLQHALANFPADALVFQMKASDQSLEAAIKKTFAGASVAHRVDLQYGGCVVLVTSRRQEFDFSLDSAVEAAKNWFIQRVDFRLEE